MKCRIRNVGGPAAPAWVQSGLTLVEIMVAITLGLILIAGAINIFLSSQQGYRLNEEISRLQENARFVGETLSRDLRMTGFKGCWSARDGREGVEIDGQAIGNDFPVDDELRDRLMRGRVGVGPDALADASPVLGNFDLIDGSDVILLPELWNFSTVLVEDYADGANDILTARGRRGDWADATDDDVQSDIGFVVSRACTLMYLFPVVQGREVSSDNGAVAVEIVMDLSAHPDEALLSEPREGDSVGRLPNVQSDRWPVYFVATADGADRAGLWRFPGGNRPAEEIVRGVEAMQVRVILDGNDTPQPAANIGRDDWGRINALEIELDLVGAEGRFNGANGDGRLRTTVTRTIQVRNAPPRRIR